MTVSSSRAVEETARAASASQPAPCRTVSLVTPVFNEQECLEAFYQRCRAVLERYGLDGFELIFVDDGSTDGSCAILHRLAAQDASVKVLTLSRNFGLQPATFAGLEFASGDIVIVLEADLQDPPELIPSLMAKCNEGYQLVFARRQGVKDSLLLRFLKRVFRALMRRFSTVSFPEHVGAFSAMDRQLKALLMTMPERSRYLAAMQLSLGFRVGYVDYTRGQRFGGRSKQNFSRLFQLGMNSLFSFSSLPLRFAMLAGITCLIVTGISMGIVLYHKVILHIAIPGWASVMIAILAMGTIQLLSLWMIGEYVDRIFENTKARPYYIVWRRVGERGCRRSTRGSTPHAPSHEPTPVRGL